MGFGSWYRKGPFGIQREPQGNPQETGAYYKGPEGKREKEIREKRGTSKFPVLEEIIHNVEYWYYWSDRVYRYCPYLVAPFSF